MSPIRGKKRLNEEKYPDVLIIDGKGKGECSSFSSSKTNRKPKEDLRGWRLVQSAASFDHSTSLSGGAFMLFDEAGVPVLARAFPVAVAAPSLLLLEVITLWHAMELMIGFGEEKLVFCCSSKKLVQCIHGKTTAGDDVGVAVKWAVAMLLHRSACFPMVRFVYRRRSNMEEAARLARSGAMGQHYIQWDKALIEEYRSLLFASPEK